MTKAFRVLILLLVAVSASATSYYIDCSGGADANAGTSTGAAWKRHPYMSGFAGSYSHSVGDAFYFKGGVTWTNGCFPLTVANAGSGTTYDYYGVTNTWYSGGSYSAPVFNGGATQIAGSGCFVYNSHNNLIVDGFLMTGFHWDTTAYVSYSPISGASAAHNFIVSNCTITNWSHTGATDTALIAEALSGSVVTNCVIDGTGGETNSGSGIRTFYKVINCTIKNVANAIANGALTGETLECYGNTIGPVNIPFQGTEHGNGIVLFGSGVTAIVASNYVHDCAQVTIYVAGATNWAYNNVVYGVNNNQDILIDGGFSAGPYGYFYNNTVPGGIRLVDKGTGALGPVWVQNNHFCGGVGLIQDIGSSSLTMDHNLTQSSVVAASFGYTAANLYQPITSSVPTVDAGITVAQFSTDILGRIRPSGSAWDIGAYEYQAPPGVTNTYGASPARGLRRLAL